jgi:hypothetical protein
LTGPVGCDPAVDLLPDQAPEAVQEVAWVEVHDKAALPPWVTVLGLAPRRTLGAAAVTVTVVDCAAVPPRPVQVRTYVELDVSAPVDWVPLVALLPDHAPEAAQDVALWVLQASEDEAPACTLLGAALKLTSGAALLTVTVTDCEAEPPGPVQVNSNSVVFDRAPLDHMPWVATAPFQPPLAKHSVAATVDQRRIDAADWVSVVGSAVNVIVGAALRLTVTCRDSVDEPPAPTQVMTKVVVAESGALDIDPLAGRLPLHPPEALQEFARSASHLSVTASPELMVVELGSSDIEGCATAAAGDPLPPESITSPPHAASPESAAQVNIHPRARAAVMVAA